MKRARSAFIVLLLMLASFTAGIEYPRGDVTQDGKVDIADVVELIDYLLKGSWSDDSLTRADETFTVNGVSFTMKAVQRGAFIMGSINEDNRPIFSYEFPPHHVLMTAYNIGETEVTQALWLAVMGDNPSHFSSRNGYEENLNRPVEYISWSDCQAFISKLNELTGRKFRLPTEAEWEYAARGGNDGFDYRYAGSNNFDDVGWCWDNLPSQDMFSVLYGTQPVASKAPNELGLYDMSGNVSEWVQDWYGPYNSDSQTNPTGPVTGRYRVFRGGSWFVDPDFGTVSYRDYDDPYMFCFEFGLRLAL